MSNATTAAHLEVSSISVSSLLQRIKKQNGESSALYRGGDELAGSQLDVVTRTRISLAVAEVNGCNYCPNTFVYLGKDANMADHDPAPTYEPDPKVDVALRFAMKVARDRGHVNEVDIAMVRAVGYDDAQVLEIVAHVAISTLNDYLNSYSEGAWG